MYGSTAAYSSMALELNASDSRGIDVVRNEIKEFAGTRQLFHKGIKLIILDEPFSGFDPVNANLIKTQIIGHDENNIGFICLWFCQHCLEQACYNQPYKGILKKFTRVHH